MFLDLRDPVTLDLDFQPAVHVAEAAGRLVRFMADRPVRWVRVKCAGSVVVVVIAELRGRCWESLRRPRWPCGRPL